MTESITRRGWLVLCLLCLLGMLAAMPAMSAQRNYYIQVFALNGPVCPVVRPDLDCPDALLPGVPLVLQQRYGRGRRWRDITSFETNAQGYATLLVHRRGVYRITVPAAGPSPFPRPMTYPIFEGNVSFKVPARHLGPTGFARVTPVVVMFDSGIR